MGDVAVSLELTVVASKGMVRVSLSDPGMDG